MQEPNATPHAYKREERRVLLVLQAGGRREGNVLLQLVLVVFFQKVGREVRNKSLLM